MAAARLATGMNMIIAPVPYFLFTSVFQRPGDPSLSSPIRPDEPGKTSSDYILCAFVARREALPADAEGLPARALQDAVVKLVDGWHPALVQLVADADPESVAPYPFHAAVRPPDWPPSRITLLGDAIHSMPPAGGNGANTALRDAHLLSLQLISAARSGLPLLRAIAGYEAEMRGYGFAAVRSALKNLQQGLASNPWTVAGMRNWFRLCSAVPPVKRLSFGDNWAKDSRPRPWESPSAHETQS